MKTPKEKAKKQNNKIDICVTNLGGKFITSGYHKACLVDVYRAEIFDSQQFVSDLLRQTTFAAKSCHP